jgi:predicted O-linked N-acetylglucosamine transferase (SPINDLY family)/predicted SAM-dependent methyltransferase/glycosyltransferase involved in cell wall biosynthesis/predicted O-methyltransferase YrrM
MKVSVFMITYNHEKFIAQAIDSILMQKVDFEYEIVIGEDYSTDNTRQIVLDYQKRYPDKIRLLLPDSNIGMLPNFMATYKACKGEYIAILEGDDYWIDPAKLKKQVDFLDKNLDFVICFAKTLHLWEDNHREPEVLLADRAAVSTIEELLLINFILPPSVMYRNGLINFPEWFSHQGMGDWSSYILLAEHGKIGYIDEVMSVYRVHDGGVWSSKAIDRQLTDTITMLNAIKKHFSNKNNQRYLDILDISIAHYSQCILNLSPHIQSIEKNQFTKSFDHNKPYKLHIGCGDNIFEDWINIDIEATHPSVDLIHDIRHQLPFDDGSCKFIYNEHVLEHLTVEEGLFFLKECHRVLQAGGVLRIAMPDLERCVEKYSSENWKDQDWLSWPEYQFIQTRAEMINIAFRWWDHKWLYDREELNRRLSEAGFAIANPVKWRESNILELNNLEKRVDSLLIFEAEKSVLTDKVNCIEREYKTNTNANKNSEKHILLYTDDPGIYGVAQHNHAIIKGLVANGYRVSCIQAKANHHLIHERKSLGVEHFWLESAEFAHSLNNEAEAKKLIQNIQPDLVIFSNCCPISNFAAKRTAIEFDIPYLVIEGFVAEYLAERFVDYLPELAQHYQKARRVIAVSDENLQLLQRSFNLILGRGQTIYLGKPTEYFKPINLSTRNRLRQELDIPHDAIVCFTAARIETVKGYQYQLDAIAQLKNTPTWQNLYFVWAGDGAIVPQIQQSITQMGVGDRVKLLGVRSDIDLCLDMADIFILASELEGMPHCIMEAMAKGLPVVASGVSGIPEELGETGKILTDPTVNSEATIAELIDTLQTWSQDSELRQQIGLACKARAMELFTVDRMISETLEVVKYGLLRSGDYVSPGLAIVKPDDCFPNMIQGNTDVSGWPYLRREVPHNWYVDRRQPIVGFLSRDEAHILYNTARKFVGQRVLEIGCWLGWSACHLALAETEVDVVDPLLDRPDFCDSVISSLQAAGVRDRVHLHPGFSPAKVEEIAAESQHKWPLIFIDGNHDAPGPLEDAIACAELATEDAIILFHDLASPDVAQGLDYFKAQGWNTMVYQTMQIMGVAWRGNIEPLHHIPDPQVNWELPSHLEGYIISGVDNDQKNSLADLASQIDQYSHDSTNIFLRDRLSNVRHELVTTCLSLSPTELELAYQGLPGQQHRLLVGNDLIETNIELQVKVINTIEQGFDRPQSINYLLAGMLYEPAYKLPLKVDISKIPDWLQLDYLHYLLSPPVLFNKVGEADRYYQYLKEWMGYFHEQILSHPGDLLWGKVAKITTYRLNCISLYFNSHNLKEIYKQRAEIIEFYLKSQSCQVDYEFPERDPQRSKIRIGILASHYTPQTETFTTLPFYQHLNRDIFEIVLYTLTDSNHRLHRYCAGHADVMVVLPTDLNNQVQVIRADNLDVLVIATNITAVTNSISLLAIHRLARMQCANNSSCVTTGIKNIDYYISGKLTEIDSKAQSHYTEMLLCIDGSAHCREEGTEANSSATITINRSSLGLSESDLVYISGANFFKITPELELTWVKILKQQPQSKLVLYPFNPNWSNSYPIDGFKQRIKHAFEQAGIESNRLLILDPVANLADVKARLSIADIYLDSFPFSSINSLLDPLKIGLPTVIHDGNNFRSLMGAAMIRSLDIKDLVADSEESYIHLAVSLGNNPALRHQKRNEIKAKMADNPIFLDSKGYGAKIGELFEELLDRYLSKNLSDNLRLRDVNLMIFPDWNQSEESLGLELQQVIKTLATQPDSQKTTLLIDTTDIAIEDAEMFLSSVAMNLMMEEDIDITEELEISLIEDINNIQWENLLPKIDARIILECDNKAAVDKLPQMQLAQRKIESFVVN